MGVVTWLPQHLEYLENSWGKASIKHIAAKVKKTETAVVLKAKRLGLGSPYNAGVFLNARQTAEVLGIDSHTITDFWIPKLGLKGKKRKLIDRELWAIDIEALMKWLKENQDRWDSRKVELYALGAEPEWLREKRKYDIDRPRNSFRKWSKYEENLVITWIKSGVKQKEIGQRLSRTTDAIQRRVSKLKAKGMLPKDKINVKWTEEEDRMLIEMDIKGLSDIEVAWELGREVIHIRDHRKSLREKGLYPGFKSDIRAIKHIERMKELKEKGKTNKDIARELGVHESTVGRRFKKYASA